ncbi:hypothetical protein FY133_24415 (plasmid) [Agrobacterium tumefaciens]|uniref:2-isopropylmalate synthase n=1 Tax=Agrobacterium tumefaciens TaxID=358 RepID=A0AAP9E9Z5_AGRTU|nr:hypothetical protein [Agrobacterium tumefaciens]NSZ61174.1 hypothetical protein [Agrobacterium tumefaciens]QDY97586.1 hypothetical protein CG010_025820 [Agrobacterium tumefaciens]UXS12713.1 hypothetical protein FY155_23965 [Agrobacterium tumefaciens]UXS20075.1 hypothetical protein FY154_23960 [Agrobacterium tumefaciens]UXS27723.1 hypothetical protein FY153_24805 [Agrobacterium tumefaciens]
MASHTEPRHGEMTGTGPTRQSARERLIIFDTTLRDGAHSPLVAFSDHDRMAIAAQLNETGVDIVEVGTPAASREEFLLVAAMSRILEKVTVCALCRPTRQEIEIAAEATHGARRRRLHTFISTSPQQMQTQGLAAEDVLAAIATGLSEARRFTDDIEWSSEDGSRSDIDFLCRCVEIAIKSGATTINIPDSTGHILPHEYEALLRTLMERVPNADRATFSVHCHDDLGLALANTLAGIQGGARQVECTIEGLGARAGNTATDEMLGILQGRAAAVPYRTNLNSGQIAKAGELVRSMIGKPKAFPLKSGSDSRPDNA